MSHREPRRLGYNFSDKNLGDALLFCIILFGSYRFHGFVEFGILVVCILFLSVFRLLCVPPGIGLGVH